MNEHDIENHMVIGSDNQTDCEYKLQQEREIAFDAQLREELEQISTAGDLNEYFELLGISRLDYLLRVQEEFAQLDAEDIATIANFESDQVNTVVNLLDVNRKVVSNVKAHLKAEAEK